MDDIRTALYERILILDGAMGTMLQRHGLSGNSEEFNFTRPETVSAIHKAYIDAGADIIETNSFSANRISQSEYGCSGRAREMALQAARLARSAADAAPRKVWVAGSAGPTSKSLTLAQDLGDPAFRQVSFDEMEAAYEEQLRGLIEGGADIILLETCFDALNTKAAIYALKALAEADESLRRPVMISATVSDRSGRTLTGQTLEAFYRSVQHAGPLSFGLNCSLGAEELAPLARDAASWAECAVSLYPNAGLPNEMGAYDQTPGTMASQLRSIARDGLLNIAGGCCGTTPEHIAAIAEALRDCPCRPRPAKSHRLHVSGLEAVTIDRGRNFTNIAERTNVAGSRKFARLISAGDYPQALAVAVSQLEGGAAIMDVNMDDAMLDSRAEMEKFLRHVAGEPAVARAAIMVDSSHWETVLAGLKNAQGKCIVNSISLKEGEESFLAKARDADRLGAAIAVMAFDEQGQAVTYERRIEVCARAYRLLTEQAGFQPQDIIFDPNVLAVSTGMPEHDNYAVDFIRTAAWIRRNLPGAHVSGGVSNLSFSFRGNNYLREAMHAVFLYHAIRAGMDMGIVNPASSVLYTDIPVDLLERLEDVVLNRRPDAAERLLEMAHSLQSMSVKDNVQVADWRNASVEERLQYALIKGVSDYLETDLAEALPHYSKAVDIIEGPLMTGMNRVGNLFGEGKMFLPQVVKTARTMKKAVSILQPSIEAEKCGGTVSAGKVLLATVKGDVHDIGKNIVSVVMACNGYEIIDLGVMVPAEVILQKAMDEKVDLIGLSGLITPSLEEMVHVATELEKAGLDIPLLIGGATTSLLHTALRIAPVYHAPVVHLKDASQNVGVAARLMNPAQRVILMKELDKEYADLRLKYGRKQSDTIPLEEARKNRLKLF